MKPGNVGHQSEKKKNLLEKIANAVHLLLMLGRIIFNGSMLHARPCAPKLCRKLSGSCRRVRGCRRVTLKRDGILPLSRTRSVARRREIRLLARPA